MRKLILVIILLCSISSFSQTKEKENKDTKDLDTVPVILAEANDLIYDTAGVEVKPEFPGGNDEMNKFVSKNFNIPEQLMTQKNPKKIIALFVVEKDGTLTDIKILRDAGFDSGAEAIRILKMMPKWKPGEQNGKKVRCLFSIPIIIHGPK